MRVLAHFSRPMLVVFLVCLFTGHVSAQSLSSMIGEVRDTTGAVIPGVVVTATHKDTGLTRSAETDSTGTYQIRSLLSGRYEVTAEAANFNKAADLDVYLAPAFQLRNNINLELGAVTTTVEVTGSASIIEAESGELAVIQGGELFGMAVAQSGTAIFTSPSQQAMLTPGQNSGGWMTFGGSRRYQTRATMDGMDPPRGAIIDGGPTNFGVEAVKTITNGAPAEYAFPVHIDQITKGGSNELHFNVGVYYNNKALNAVLPFGGARPPGVSQWEPTINAGGPVYIPGVYDGRNKTFWFTSWVRQKENLTATRLQTVPTTAMRAGDFSGLTDASGNTINIKNPFTGEAFPGNRIDPALIPDSAERLIAAYFPAPTTAGVNLNYLAVVGGNAPFDACLCGRHSTSIRGDQVIGDKDLLTVTFTEGGTPFSDTDVGDQLWGNNLANAGFYSHSVENAGAFMVREAHTFSPTWLNEFGFGYHFYERDQEWPDLVADDFIAGIGLKGIPTRAGITGYPSLRVTGYNPTPFRRTFESKNSGWQLKDNVTWVAGRHEVKFGFNYKQNRSRAETYGGSAFGNFNFTGGFTGHPAADLLLGLPESNSLTDVSFGNQNNTEVGFFIQNKIRLSSKLTIDVGIRWQRWGAPYDPEGRHFNFDPATGSIVIPNGAAGLVSPAFPSNISVVTADTAGFPNRLVEEKSRLLPRLGFAYRISDKTVLRSSFGMYSAMLTGGGTAGAWTSALFLSGGPFSQSQSFTNAIDSGSALFQFPQAVPSRADTVGAQSVTAVKRDIIPPYTMQWNLTLEREVRNTSVRLSYLGQRSVNMIYSRNINLPRPEVGVPFNTNRLIYTGFRNISLRDNGANTAYNAMQFTVQRHIRGGLAFQGGWTWSKNLSDIGWGTFPGPVGSTSDPFNRAAQRGNTDITPRHDARLQWVYEVPLGKKRGGFLAGSDGMGAKVLDRVIGGWNVSGLLWTRTGYFFTPSFSGSDPSGLGISGGRPDAVSGCDPNQNVGARLINPDCFTAPGDAIGRFGNAGVGTLHGPGDKQLDMALWKDFSTVGGEHPLNITIGVSMFDLFNTASYNNPRSNVGDTNYGLPDNFQRSLLSFGGKFHARAIEFRMRLTY